MLVPIGYNKKVKENEKYCTICGKQFRRRGQRKYTAKFCSQKCKGIWQKINWVPINSGKDSKKEYICEKCGKTFKDWLGIHGKRKYCSMPCANKGTAKSRTGENHYNWKGGVKPINQKLRASAKYNDWRKRVFKRDKWKCKICGQVGGKLEADHILSWAEYPSERFKIKNGRTLCKECHKKTPNYKRPKLKK